MEVSFPALVIENILLHLPMNERLSARLISSHWDSTIMTRIQPHETHRVYIRGKTDLRAFVKTFTKSKYEVPFRRYVVSPRESSEEELVQFAKLVGPRMIELSGDTYTAEGGIIWDNITWRRSRRGGGGEGNRSDHPAVFFERLECILQHTPNLEYLGIMYLGNNIKKGPPIVCKAIPNLPQLRIFSRVPDKRYDGWCESLISQAPLLQNARKIQASEFDLDCGDFGLMEPSLIHGYSLSNDCVLDINGADSLVRLEASFKMATKNRMFMRIICTPSRMDKASYHLPLHKFTKISSLFYDDISNGNLPLCIQDGQFPALRHLTISCSSTCTGTGEYPFQGCVLRTVKKLSLGLAMKDFEGWNLATIFPNVEILLVYIRSELKEYQLWDLLQPFQGSESLNSLTIEDCHRRVFQSTPNISNWEELLGLGGNHSCSGRKVPGFSPLIQSRCSIPNCEGGKGLIFPAVKQLNISDVVLDKFFPLLIRGVRSGGFPAVEKIELNGYKSKDYCATEVPNVEDYMYILCSIVEDVKFESDN